MEIPEVNKKYFKELNREIYTRERSNTENYDKAILSLSSAGLGFSLAFIKNIVPLNLAQNTLLL